MDDVYGEPRDVLAERAVIGCLLGLTGPLPDNTGLHPELFWRQTHREIAAACLKLAANSKPTDPVTVRAELLRAGLRGPTVDPVELFALMQEGCLPAQLSFHARSLQDLAVRRDVMFQARQALQHAANPTADPYEVAAELHVAAGVLADSGDPIRATQTTDAKDFLAMTDTYDWLVPGLLERGDRLLITGGEGSGKASCVGSLRSLSRPARTLSPAGTPNRAGSPSSTSRTVSGTYGGRSGRCGSRPPRYTARSVLGC